MGLLSRAARQTAQQFGPDDFARFFGSQLDNSPAARMARADELFPVQAYRGLRGVHDDAYATKAPQWFSSSPEVTNSYVQTGSGMQLGEAYPGANVLPSRLNLGKVAEIDAAGAPYFRIPRSAIPKDILRNIETGGRGPSKSYSTDTVQHAAERLGYDSVRFRNIRDAMASAADNVATVPPSDVFAINPRAAHNVRAAWAQFDPARAKEADILAGLGLAVGGGGLLSYGMQGRQY